jgi:glutaminyl-peptide cyclotransferase
LVHGLVLFGQVGTGKSSIVHEIAGLFERRLISASTPTTLLSTIDHLVLLDLLGAPHPRVHSYFPDTAWLFDVLVNAETRPRDSGIIDAATLGGSFFHTHAAGDISLAYM